MSTQNSFNERLDHLAHTLVVRRVAHGLSKSCRAEFGLNLIASISTERTSIDCIKKFLRWRSDIRLAISGPFHACEIQEFLYELEDECEQKALDVMRQVLQKVFSVALLSATSQRTTVLASRAYSMDEITLIISHQAERNQIATKICFFSGARAHELLTLRRASELSRSPHRPWRKDLHCCMEAHEIYTVQGKGGLRRHIAIRSDLAAELEYRRIASLTTVFDRGIEFTPHYDIGGGQAFSQSFGTASMAALGNSTGAHGLRHSYAQNRFLTMKAAGVSTEDSLLILSQEMGHFRPSITLVYLR